MLYTRTSCLFFAVIVSEDERREYCAGQEKVRNALLHEILKPIMQSFYTRTSDDNEVVAHDCTCRFTSFIPWLGSSTLGPYKCCGIEEIDGIWFAGITAESHYFRAIIGWVSLIKGIICTVSCRESEASPLPSSTFASFHCTRCHACDVISRIDCLN